MNSVLITGASSGIGLELARIFAEKSYKLVLVARRMDRLIEIKEELLSKYNTEVDLESIDLLDFKNIDLLIEKYYDIDILINNAGFGIYSKFLDYNQERDEDMIKLNIIVPTLMTKKYAKIMKKGSKILNIASTAGYQPVPYMAVYAATKSYLIDFTIAISKESNDIDILVYSPGETKTEFQKIAKRPKSGRLRGPIPSAKEVALDIYRSVVKGRRNRIYGIYNKILIAIGRLLTKNIIANSILRNNEKLR